MLRAREISARELLDAHLDRIERLNPDVNAVVTLDAEGARAAADAADAALAAGEDGRPAARAAGRAQGHPRHRRHADDVGLAAARRHRAAARRAGRGPATRRPARSGSARPTCRSSRPARTRSTRSSARPTTRTGTGCRPAARRAGRRPRWPPGFVPLADGSDMGGSLRNPAGVLQRRRPAAHAGAGADLAGAHGLVAAVGAGADGPHGRRRRAAAVGARRAGPAGADLAVRRPGRVRRAAARPSLAGLRVAWAPDLGGRVTVDPAITAVLASSVRGVRGPRRRRSRRPARTSPAPTRCSARCGPGCSTRPTATWPGGTRTRSRSRSAGTPRWARSSPAPTSPAPRSRTPSCTSGWSAFFERYDVLLAPTTQVLPFPVELEYPTEIGGVPPGQLPGVDALLHGHLGDRLPGAVGARRVHRRRAAGRAADHRGAAGRPAGARGGPRLRAGDPLRRAPSRPLTRSTAL